MALARHRRAAISELRYQISFTVPENRAQAVTGAVTIRFRLARAERVILDFRAPAENVGATRVNGQPVQPLVTTDHVTIPGPATTAGENTVEIQFTATDAALNRRDDYFYALFVPDRASTAFPCFDQPDLKARFQVNLRIPAAWRAVANGSVIVSDSSGPIRAVSFRETAPISTYLVSFAAGKLATEEAVRDGRRFTMYHRETDSAKVARNRAAIFDLHAASLAWLERYTGIPYPFEKFDFFAIPAFQFGGMEHPGAVWYNASGLFLDQSATRNQHLGRASLIAHETAHMWFGDLVTMEWFNDVWMKEVFANFMAAKIVGPEFADINHDLRFFLAHQPSAHEVDRTAGANPIRQPLENLREAGSLYGAIIYQKAPVVMRQLERTIGEASMERGLREYLDRHRFGNATWTDLIAVLDRLTPADLRTWSRVWVEEPGRPTIALGYDAPSRQLRITQADSRGRGLLWPQTVAVTAGGPDGPVTVTARLDSRRATVPLPFAPRYLLGGTDGVGYGRFTTDRSLRPALIAALPDFADPVARSVGWQTLVEELIDGTLDPTELLDAAGAALLGETDDLISQQLLGVIQLTYWRYLTPETRASRADRLEAALLERLERADRPGRKGAFFNALVNVTVTPNGLDRLERIWRRTDTLVGLPLEEPQYTTLAETLALKRPERAEAILDEQQGRIQDPDRLARFRFVRRALSPSAATRDSIFATFGDLASRRRESWVLDAARYLNHPLRAAEAIRYLRPSLDLVEEIKRTGDIFFPLNWLSATLDGHQSAEAAAIVARFLADHPRYPPRLKGKIEQAADGLFRAARAVDRWRPRADR
ncbi:MAG: M1 family metallopeptidase [Gemmatimonadales bacterium]